MRTCRRCKQPKEISEFGADASRADDLNPYCKPCITDRARMVRHGELTVKRRVRRRDRGEPRPPGAPRIPKPPPVTRPYKVALPDVFKGITRRTVAHLILRALDAADPHRCTQRTLHAYVVQHLPKRCGNYPETVTELIGEALGELFNESLIRTAGSDETRIYFRRAAAA